MQTLGAKLRILRKANGYSLRDLEDKININYSHLAKIERGEANPSMQVLKKLANLYDKSVSHFFDEAEKIGTPQELDGHIKWIALGREFEGDSLTPEQVKKIVDIYRKMKEL